ncbi:hypothetical protein COOONC_09782, partial [Cooperia oncophora]
MDLYWYVQDFKSLSRSDLTNPPQETSTAEATPTLLGKKKNSSCAEATPAKRERQTPTSEDAEAMPLHLSDRRPCAEEKECRACKVSVEGMDRNIDQILYTGLAKLIDLLD